MNKILSELWNGTLSPISTCGMGDYELHRLARLMERNHDCLEQMLTPEQKKIFDKFHVYLDEYQQLLNEAAFTQGFSVATKMFCQTLATPIGSERQL